MSMVGGDFFKVRHGVFHDLVHRIFDQSRYTGKVRFNWARLKVKFPVATHSFFVSVSRFNDLPRVTTFVYPESR